MAQAHFTVTVGEFRGPLEMLLDLIERRRLFVNDISLADVADDYIRYIQEQADIPLTETAQFVLVASTLLLIKSRSLLPSFEFTREEEADIHELERRLAQYARVREVTRSLKKRWGVGYLYTTRHRRVREVSFCPANDITPSAIAQAGQSVARALPTAKSAPTARVTRTINLDEVIDSLHERIERACNDSFRSITSHADRIETIVHFLALLELVKRGTIAAAQEGHFTDINLERTTAV